MAANGKTVTVVSTVTPINSGLPFNLNSTPMAITKPGVYPIDVQSGGGTGVVYLNASGASNSSSPGPFEVQAATVHYSRGTEHYDLTFRDPNHRSTSPVELYLNGKQSQPAPTTTGPSGASGDSGATGAASP